MTSVEYVLRLCTWLIIYGLLGYQVNLYLDRYAVMRRRSQIRRH
jgi:hypothetical protein